MPFLLLVHFATHMSAVSDADIDECQQPDHGCKFYCENLPGGYRCACPANMMLDSDQVSCIPYSAAFVVHFESSLLHEAEAGLVTFSLVRSPSLAAPKSCLLLADFTSARSCWRQAISRWCKSCQDHRKTCTATTSQDIQPTQTTREHNTDYVKSAQN
ncbi:unnamed protein product [Protopolystoma xenopodis]|uniref:EGF-like calcium-binding domain-containing protein n=1 Tax=Protopolystoma xenopodis TaxID=117903 RepID=A0A3S5FHC9_9PLAT|nr:unnamed protein product [Protopolystoma xenopodis]